MNIQSMMAQAQKMQRELKKAHDELAKEEFIIEKGGAVKLLIYGDRTIKSITFNEDVLEKDNKEMLEEMVKLAFEEALNAISNAEEEVNERITGRAGGLGF